MDIETLEKRIASCEAKIEKLEKSIVRVKKERDRNVKDIEERVEDEKEIERMTAFFDENMNYELRGIYREIKDTEQKLQKYIVQLEEEQKKEANRTVQVILDFLENWKQEAFDYYIEMLPKYEEAYKKLQEQREAFLGDDIESRRERFRLIEEFKQKWNWFTHYLGYGINQFKLDETRLKRDLEKDAKIKYDTLVGKIQDIVGTITDASGLYIANNGQINGIIKGDSGSARVETVDAGGYNIQRFHYRTLVHPV